ncbi:hypothetical protein CCUS01_02774 [Colletotrichum cuscutae]|uniref:Uncharacterized protein n=1 Tax=Colletotrichum cuscutae TaxID=1209917 RepID=A0AAJ0DP04_9PEZI|nr:hypothetical protein CCUS01_02774 [Colletotrichum cuscutae]
MSLDSLGRYVTLPKKPKDTNLSPLLIVVLNKTQTLRYMPWIAFSHESLSTKNSDNDKLDYTAMLPPKVWIESWRRKHYLVFLVAIISIALKIQIVLAPGLYSVQTIEAGTPVDIEILDSFNTTVPPWRMQDTSPYYIARAISNFDMGYPFGVNERISYQTFKSKTTVAGLSTETQCLKLENYSYSEITQDVNKLSLYSLRGATIDTWIPGYDHILRRHYWKLFSLRKPFCFDQTNIIPTINSSSLDFDLAASQVEVLPDENRYPITANLWDLIGNSVPSGISWNQSNINRLFRQLVKNGRRLIGLMDMSRILGPWIGHYRLRHSDGQYLNATGWTCLSMTTIFGLAMLMVALVLLFFENMTMIWYRDLLTVIGNMIFLQHQRRSSDGGSKDSPRLKDKAIEWGNCDFTPLVLKVWARASIISLIVVYQGIATVSEEANHTYLFIALYTNSFDSTYRGLATLSALAIKSCRVTVMDMSFSNMLGLQVLYHSLRAHIGTVTVTQFLAIICGLLTTLASVVFTVKTIPETSTISLQQKTWFGSGEIRNATELSRKRQTLSSLVLRQGDGLLTYPKNTYDTLVFPTFGTSDGLDPSQNISIKANISVAMLKPNCWIVPPDVYNLTKLERIDGSDGYFTVQPQITESFTCPHGSQAQLSQTIAFVLGERKSDYVYLATGLDSPEDLRIVNRSCGLSLRDTDIIPASTKFMTYALGKYSQEQEKFLHLSITRCQYSWVELPTEVNFTFRHGEFVLNPGDLPRPDESRAQPWGMPFNIPDIYDALPEVTASDPYAGYFDSWFRTLSSPFGRFSLDAFGDPNFEEEILKDIHHLYGFLAAQLVNLENRIDITQSSKDNPPPTPFNLTANVINLSRRRLVQDPIVTYVIIGILALTALLSLLMLITDSLGTASSKSQLFSMRIEGLAPDGYNSIAAMTALLKDSNAVDHLPEGAEHMSKKELHEKLSGLRFRMGWFWRESTQTRHYTIGVLDDENFEFLGNKDEIAREDALLRHPPERGRPMEGLLEGRPKIEGSLGRPLRTDNQINSFKTMNHRLWHSVDFLCVEYLAGTFAIPGIVGYKTYLEERQGNDCVSNNDTDSSKPSFRQCDIWEMKRLCTKT